MNNIFYLYDKRWIQMKLLLTSVGFENSKVGKKFLEVVGKLALTDNQALLIFGNRKEIIE